MRARRSHLLPGAALALTHLVLFTGEAGTTIN